MSKKIHMNYPVFLTPKELAGGLIGHLYEQANLDREEFIVHERHQIANVPIGHLSRLHEKSSEYATYVYYPDNGKPTKKQAENLRLIALLKEVK